MENLDSNSRSVQQKSKIQEPFRISSTFAFLNAEDSTRTCGILRIGLACLLWAESAKDLAAYHKLDPLHFVFGITFFLASLAMGLGFKSRVSTAITGIMMLITYYYFGIELGQRRAFVHHHSYLLAISTSLLALTPCGRSFSWDRWYAVQQAKRKQITPPRERGTVWGLKLMALQLSLVYFWGAYDKSTWAFFSGARLEHMFIQYYGTHEGLSSPFFSAFAAVAGSGTVVFEYVIAFGMWIPRWQIYLIPAGILFHLSIYYLLPVGTFSVLSCLLYLAYVPPERFHRFMDAMIEKQSIPTTGNTN